MSRLRFRLFSLATDALFVNAAVLAAFALRFLGDIPQYNLNAYLTLLPLLTLSYLICGWLYGLYDPEQIDSPWSTTSKTFTAATLGTLVLTAIAFLGGTMTTAFSRLTIPLIWGLTTAFMLGWRLLFLRFGTIHWPEQRTLIVGTGETAQDLACSLNERTKWGWKLVALISPDITSTQLDQQISEFEINRIIIAEPERLREFIERLVLADHASLTVDVVPELYETFIGNDHTIVGDIPLMRIVSSTIPRYHRVIKRVLDIIAAFLLLTVLSPLLLLIALIALVSQGRPVLYRQTRVGQHQKPFRIYKFRTMTRDAEKLSGPVLATEDDPRITPLGRRLRRFRLDELPQVLNILRGDMSFIGPRPERPVFVEGYLRDIPGYSERFRVKPGATGLAQINGGYATTPERKLKYDLMYLYHQSLALDVQIIVETVRVVLTGKGAR